MFDPGLKIGQILKNADVVNIFKCGNMGGMRRSKTTNTLVLVSARRLVFEYIHVFYNARRIHSHCNYLSPSDYKDKYLEELEMEMRLAI